MALLGTLLKNRRCGDTHSAWGLPTLQGPETMSLTSASFEDAGAIPAEHAGTRIGGRNISPGLSWSDPPTGTTALLLVVEDLDVPVAKPFVHCLALIDPSGLAVRGELPPGSLSAAQPGAGTRVLRSTMGRGYRGPEPIKGHGPHHYVFQLYAFSAEPIELGHAELARAKAREVLAHVTAPVTARARLVGTYER